MGPGGSNGAGMDFYLGSLSRYSRAEPRPWIAARATNGTAGTRVASRAAPFAHMDTIAAARHVLAWRAELSRKFSERGIELGLWREDGQAKWESHFVDPIGFATLALRAAY